MMFQLPPLRINLPKPKYKNQEIVTDDGRRVACRRRDTCLDMSQMCLNHFPKMILKCHDLDTLILNRNFLRAIPHKIIKLEYLETLDLSFNRLHEIPLEIFCLDSLRELYLNNNVISDIPLDIRYLKYLKILNVSNNRIKRLPNNMQHLRSLVTLNVAFNKIEEYPEQLCSCFTQLQVLKCAYNFISILPYEVIFMSELARKVGAVDFSHNPLTWPTMDIVIKGLDSIRDYIEPKWRELREFKQRKLTRDSYKSQATNLNAANLWDKEPSISSNSTSSKKPKPVSVKLNNNNTTAAAKLITPQSKKKAEPKVVKTTKKAKKAVPPKKETSSSRDMSRDSGGGGGYLSPHDNLDFDLDDSSRVTLVEVYGDSRSTIGGVLSPVQDATSPLKDAARDCVSDEDDSVYSDGRGSLSTDLIDVINESLEPPDLDIPDCYHGNTHCDNMNSSQYSGGGMLEQWLGTVQSLTVSPTSRDLATSRSSRDLATSRSSNLSLDDPLELEQSSERLPPFTPFSDVVITKSVKDDSDTDHLSGEYDEQEEVVLDDQSRDLSRDPMGAADEDFQLRHSISSPDFDRLSVIFSDDNANLQQTITKSEDSAKKKEDLTKPKLKKMTSFSSRGSAPSAGRRSSTGSMYSDQNSKTPLTVKKKKRKKKKKKLKKELSELELYSRIPFKPLLIAPRTAPCSRGLRTWCYFTEPKSCYLIDNMTEISSTKRVTFGADEVTILSSTPSTISLLTESCIANNSSDSFGRGSVHSLDSHNSQQLSLSRSTAGSSMGSSQLLDGSMSDMSTIGALLSTSSKFLPSTTGHRRPSSLPAPKEHTWTSQELQKYIYKPSDLIIPPKVLVSYLGNENDHVHRNQILKLVNTLEMYGFAECICDITDTDGDIATYDLEERGYVAWLDDKIQEAEFVLLVLSPQYVQHLPYLTKLDSYTALPVRGSPYITPADIKRWDINVHEVYRRFVPIFNDDSGGLVVPSWLQVPPFFVPSELCELGYHLVSRDSRESVIIPNLFDKADDRDKDDTQSKDDVSTTDIGSDAGPLDSESAVLLQIDIFRVLPVTAHLTVLPHDIPPDWRLEEIAGKIRYYWRKFARTCGIEAAVINEIDSVYSGMLAKSLQCLKTWKKQLVGGASYEELARRLDQIDQKHIADAYCNFGSFNV